MLQLVVRQLLDLTEITLGHQLEVGPALIAGQLLVDDLPADVAGREHVADARRVGPIASHRADLLVAVGMPEGEPVARGLRYRTAVLKRFDEPVAAVEPNDGARREGVLCRVLPPILSAGAVDGDDLVGGGHGVQLTRRTAPGTPRSSGSRSARSPRPPARACTPVPHPRRRRPTGR